MNDEKKEPKKVTLSLPKQLDTKASIARTRAQVRPPQPGGTRKPKASAQSTVAAEATRPERNRAPRSAHNAKTSGEKLSARNMRPPARGETKKETSYPEPRFDKSASRSKQNDNFIRPPRRVPTPSADGTLRLSKRMAELGLCSRREADEYIERGWVKVDGVVISELGSRVLPEQNIELSRQAATAQDRRVTILLNKPIGFVSGQAEDGYKPASVLVTEENQWEYDPTGQALELSHFRSLAPAGRLDIDSTGLLVLTQDGRVARSLIGEKSPIEKEYLVRVEGGLSDENMRLLQHGLTMDGVKLKPAKVSWANEDQLRFVLHEGRKRQIRRMCEMVGLNVVGLRRVRIGRIPLGKLPIGQWRFLGEFEKF
ncbi:MAG TPA: pseudouridine synthase [Rhodocyclaceae bacterium]|nr:pseudouridine synthase [Rhodocyclaceae bacterium]